MRNLKLFSLLFTAAVAFVSCEDKDPPVVINEEEVITTLTATLTPEGGGASVTLKSRDLDGDGPDDPVITVGDLVTNTTYTGVLEILNEEADPPEDVTEEIEEEDEEHQFFFESTNNFVTVTYDDMDSDGNPIGIEFTLTTTSAGSGDLTITLRHEPNKNAAGVSEGNIENAGGETDIEVTFDITVK